MHIIHSVLNIILNLSKDIIDFLLSLDEDLQRRVVNSVRSQNGGHLGAIMRSVTGHHRNGAVLQKCGHFQIMQAGSLGGVLDKHLGHALF